MESTKTNVLTELIEKIETKTATVGVIGLGYVGLPLAVEKAKVGYRVIGIEHNPLRAQQVNQGQSYIADVKTEELRPLVEQGLLKAVCDFNDVETMDALIICVPTPLTKNRTPDLQYVESVTHAIARHLRPGHLIALESTTYPGTTDEVMLPILEASGLQREVDFFLAHSPERVDPGNQRYTTKNTNKIVGAVGPQSLYAAETFYKQTVEHVVTVSSAKTAELVKVFENTFRAVNIALVNELTLLCDRMNVSIWDVLDAANTKPFGIMPFYPGLGVGGHCIPIDPHYLEWKAKELNFNTHFIALAGEVNRRMPEFVLEKTQRVLNGAGKALSQSTILVLGVAYKKDLGDFRESPAIEVIRLLKQNGAHVLYHDPLVPAFEEHGVEMSSQALTGELVESCDLVLITTDHSEVEYQMVLHHAHLVLDTRNVTRSLTEGREKVTLL
ncbi:nucleotide sugar dehydrogenase [Tumebacillus flagellatus]|uniref:UDP-N-acetyl-D-glucosamine dehydrogenase n=1 Tax=Tumebacillus flagellatus TaxID=1157490 RepID=A0A074LIR5_9BACL|nr:nucleotide sugar dehydrogenase [Tumebacillus flagellatus]KEO81024.1 UDP-N-acetyl-D-glucosamine dehydrogenase [Tumebacillus flagellatus]